MLDKPLIGVLALQGAVEPHHAHIEAAGAEFRAVKTPAQFEEVDGFILPGGESTTMLKLIDTFGLWDILAQQFKTKPVWGICAGAILLAQTVLYQKSSSSRQSNALLKQRGSSDVGSKAAVFVDPVRANASSEACQRDDGEWNTQKSFGILPITVERNGYGRQLDSHFADIDGYEVAFIRAPVITVPSPSIPLPTISFPPLPSGRGQGRGKPNEERQGEELEILAEHQGNPVWVQYGHKMVTSFHPELSADTPSPMHRMFVDLVRKST